MHGMEGPGKRLVSFSESQRLRLLARGRAARSFGAALRAWALASEAGALTRRFLCEARCYRER